MTKTLVVVFCSLSLMTCASQRDDERKLAGPALQIAGVEIYNGLAYSIQDVSILVPESGDYVSCGQILPDSSCSTTFEVRDYRENPVQVLWTEHGEPQSTKPFTIKAPEDALAGQDAYIRVEVFGPGQAGAKLLLMDPGVP
ncbi:MAG TPA: hypothetical protein VFG52_03175 [Xanthomonadales bacterium]|nr:hypothetical protein [Xanthomonadales bacterium]